MQEQVDLGSVLVQQSKEQCTSLQAEADQLREDRRDSLNRLANTKSELSRRSKHTSQAWLQH